MARFTLIESSLSFHLGDFGKFRFDLYPKQLKVVKTIVCVASDHPLHFLVLVTGTFFILILFKIKDIMYE